MQTDEDGSLPYSGVDWLALQLSRSIAAMLTMPVAVLPARRQDQVKPFVIGLGAEIAALRQVGVSSRALHDALYRYTHCPAYRHAVSRRGSMRHNLQGETVELVSPEDRLQARAGIRKGSVHIQRLRAGQ